jgi:ADP-dependent NAD(P)H-hydrate dehydratase
MATPTVSDIDPALLRRWPLPLPDGDGDKESRGRVLIIAGCRELPGAPVLAARAALRAGAGKVLVATTEAVALPVGIAVPELRVAGFSETAQGAIDPRHADALAGLAGRVAALLIGPGMVDEAATVRLATELITRCSHIPVILDAAAMPALLSVSTPSGTGPSKVLVTPHAGEMAHLSGQPRQAIEDDAVQAALEAARRWQALVALKGWRTAIAGPDGRAWRHESPNPGLATAGSGDVLAGLIAGLAARGAALDQAAVWGVALHAEAGRRLARRVGPIGFLASEIAAEIPALLESWQPEPRPASAIADVNQSTTKGNP